MGFLEPHAGHDSGLDDGEVKTFRPKKRPRTERKKSGVPKKTHIEPCVFFYFAYTEVAEPAVPGRNILRGTSAYSFLPSGLPGPLVGIGGIGAMGFIAVEGGIGGIGGIGMDGTLVSRTL